MITLGIAALIGELNDFSFAQVSLNSVLGLAYIIFIGAVICYLAYFFLLQRHPAAELNTYGFVHPIVAICLGVLMADEVITSHIVIAMLLILTAVFLIQFPKQVAKLLKM